MIREEKSEVILKISGILAALISAVTFLSVVWDGKWSFYLLLPLRHIFLHIALWVLFWSSRVYRDMKKTALLTVGMISLLVSGYCFVSSVTTFFLIPTLRTGLYLLAFPTSALFLIGVIIRGQPKSGE